MSRSRTRERRQQREAERKRQQRIVIAAAIAAVAVLGVIFFILAQQPAEAVIPEGVAERYEGIPQSVSDAGYPVLGNPNAPVQVTEYSSFDCPHCKDFHAEAVTALAERAREGEIAFTYVPIYGTGGIANGQGAARAAVCAGEQDAFWPYHSTLFEWQNLYGNTAFAGNRLTSGVDNLGLDRAAWDACFASQRPDEVLENAINDANNLSGFSGTPTITVNGQIVTPTLSAVNAAIDAALLTAPPVEDAPVDAESTTEAEATEAAEETATEEAEAEATEDE